ncbi:MAG TPA: hypothetical protein VI485_16010 [Vicinamibacterales bacterium]|nr:hypothetical protein [Vicinamibacterales bacterium]
MWEFALWSPDQRPELLIKSIAERWRHPEVRSRPDANVTIRPNDNVRTSLDRADRVLEPCQCVDRAGDILGSSSIAVDNNDSGSSVVRQLLHTEEVPIECEQRAAFSPAERRLIDVRVAHQTLCFRCTKPISEFDEQSFYGSGHGLVEVEPGLSFGRPAVQRETLPGHQA